MKKSVKALSLSVLLLVCLFVTLPIVPVSAQSIFGNNNIGGTGPITPGADNKVGSRFTLSESGTLESITVYLSNADGSDHNVKAAIYDDSGGAPNNLVASGGPVTVVASTVDWYTITVSASLSAGDYHLVVKWDDVNIGYYYDVGSYWNRKAEAYGDAFSEIYGVPDSTKERDMSIYATYSTGGENGYISYYFNSGGQFRVNGSLISNGTVTQYSNQTLLMLLASTSDSSYVFESFSYDASSSTVNPYNYTVNLNDTVWCLFGVAGTSEASPFPTEFVYVLAMFAVGLTVVFVVGKKHKENEMIIEEL